MDVLAWCAAVCIFGGDSLAVGMARGADLPSRAIEGIRISHPAVERTVREAPAGAVVLLSVGTNDDAPIAGPLDRLLQAARERGVRLVVLTPPCHRPPALDARARLRAEEARTTGVETVDLRQLPTGACGATRAPDGIHFTARGYRALAEEAIRVVASR